jgi:hypothetical protein
MAGINARGVVVGGLVAGLIINIGEFILNVPVLGAQLEAEMIARNLPPIATSAIVAFVTFGFIQGVLIVWLYAAIRPRFGPGPKTAIVAGLFVWFLASLYSSVAIGLMGFLAAQTLTIATVWSLVEMLIAALAGAALYKEGA